MALGLSEKQIEMRRTGIGASEIAAVVGLVPGAIEIYERKMGLAPEFEGNSLTEFGLRIERVLGEAWKERNPGWDIFTPGTMRHPTVPIALASPDRVVVPVGRRAREVWKEGLEMKVSFFNAKEFGESGSDEIPERYTCQTQWQMEVCNLPMVRLVALVNGDYREYPIARDREFGAMLLEGAQKWWREFIETRTPPPVDGSEAYAAYIRRRFPKMRAPAIPATVELAEMVSRYKETKEAFDQAKEFNDEAKQALQVLIGEAEGIEGMCSWKNNKDGKSTDWEKVASDLRGYLPPSLDETITGIIAKHTTTTPGARVLRLTKEKKS
jgi:putative phage-type endonuclease